MHVDLVRVLVGLAGEVQHCGPEQGVEIDNVFADEVNLLGLRIGEKFFEIHALLRAVILEAREIANRGVEPDIEIFAGRVGNRDAEIGRVARNVPVAERFLGFAFEPLFSLVRDLRLQSAGFVEPLLDEIDALLVGQFEKVVLRRFHHRRCAGQRRIRIFQIGWRVNRTADFAGVAVLVLRAAFRAFALNVTVGEEHVLDRVVKLLDRLRIDEARRFELAVDVLRHLGIFRRMGRVPVIEGYMKAIEVFLALGTDARNELLGRDAFGFGLEHDGRAVRVVGAHEMYFVALHALEPHPDIGLDVLHDVADMERSVRVRQRGGDKQFARHRALPLFVAGTYANVTLPFVKCGRAVVAKILRVMCGVIGISLEL